MPSSSSSWPPSACSVLELAARRQHGAPALRLPLGFGYPEPRESTGNGEHLPPRSPLVGLGIGSSFYQGLLPILLPSWDSSNSGSPTSSDWGHTLLCSPLCFYLLLNSAQLSSAMPLTGCYLPSAYSVLIPSSWPQHPICMWGLSLLLSCEERKGRSLRSRTF
jgi:hypothetical protein